MPAPRMMECSRTVPVDAETAFARTLTAPLPSVFRRWYGPIAPVAEVREQEGEWGTPGQTRTVVQARGAGAFRETLAHVDAPRSFGYVLTHVTGPVSTLITTVDGEWQFTPSGDGCDVTWRWNVLPASSVAAVLLPGFARMWQGYARQGLDELSRILVR